MNQTAKAARSSFYVKGDDSNPNKGQPVSKADEKQSTETTVSPYYTPSAAWNETLTCQGKKFSSGRAQWNGNFTRRSRGKFIITSEGAVIEGH
jgi:hypothetical protein